MSRNFRFGSIVLAVLALIAFAGIAVQAGDEKEVQKDVTVKIEGMTCGDCCVKVETAVKALDGVVEAKADYKAGNAKITYTEGRVTVDQIVAAINEKTSFKASVPAPKA